MGNGFETYLRTYSGLKEEEIEQISSAATVRSLRRNAPKHQGLLDDLAPGVYF